MSQTSFHATGDQTVVVVGGGPAGVACALTVLRLSRMAGRAARVVLFEGKDFDGRPAQHNQCVGVLSPPIWDILERQLGIAFPWSLVCRPITTYVLHSDRRQIALTGDEVCYTVHRVEFDGYLLERAREVGVEVVSSRVHDLEFHADRVVVYAESQSIEAAIVVGAFGLDDGAIRMFERATVYRAPKTMTSIVTKIQPDSTYELGNSIHAFLPSLPEIEFGAVTPKAHHLTANIAGMQVDVPAMECFLGLPSVRAVLPPREVWQGRCEGRGPAPLSYFRGRFPVSVASGIFGDRYIVVGDAAGLIRPFKGKGIAAGLRGGLVAGEAVIRCGTSRLALGQHLMRSSYAQEVLGDRPYGAALRLLANLSANYGFLDLALEVAERNEHLRRALYDAVSAHQTYRQIVRDTAKPGLFAELAGAAVRHASRAIIHHHKRDGQATVRDWNRPT